MFNEWLLKSVYRELSIHLSNLQIYSFGVLCNGGLVLSSEGELAIGRGYNRYSWALVANYSLMGLILSRVMKYFSNITKVVISASSMYFSAAVSYLLWGTRISGLFAWGLVITTAGLGLYVTAPEPRPTPAEPLRQLRPELKGSVGEGPNQTNYSDQSSVKIVAKLRNFR